MKKIGFLLAILCICFLSFAQNTEQDEIQEALKTVIRSGGESKQV